MVLTTAVTDMSLRGLFNGQRNASSSGTDTLSKMTAVNSGLLPRRYTNLSLGLALVPHKLVVLWYMASLLATGDFTRMIGSLSWVNCE